jgi:hypothetical protein
MGVWRGRGGTGRFLRTEEGGPWERWRVQKDTGSEPEASDGHSSFRTASESPTSILVASVSPLIQSS